MVVHLNIPLVINGGESFDRAFAFCVRAIEVDGVDRVTVDLQSQLVPDFRRVLADEFGYVLALVWTRGLITRVEVWEEIPSMGG